MQEEEADPTTQAPSRFQQPMSSPLPTADSGHTEQTSFGQLGDRERQEMVWAMWNTLEERKDLMCFGLVCETPAMGFCPNSDPNCRWNSCASVEPASKAGHLSQGRSTFQRSPENEVNCSAAPTLTDYSHLRAVFLSPLSVMEHNSPERKC